MKAFLTSPFRHPLASVVVVALALAVGWASFSFGKRLWRSQRLNAAEAALLAQDFDRALAEYELVLEQWPDRIDVRLEAAQAARRAEQLDKAEMYLAQVEQAASRRRLPADLDLALERACLRAQQGDIEEVLSYLHAKVREGGPAGLLAQEALVLGYAELRQPDGITFLEKSLQGAHHQLLPRLVKIRFLFSSQQYDNMIDDCRKALTNFPEAYGVRLWLAKGLHHMGKTREAVREFQALVQMYPDRAEAAVDLASCRAELHQFDQAQVLLDQVLAKHPKDYSALLERARLTLRIGKPEEGEPFARRALEAGPGNREAFTTLVQVLQEQQKDEEAAAVKKQQDETERAQGLVARDLDSATSKGVLTADARVELATRLMKVKREEEAFQLLITAMSTNSRHRGARQALAEYFERKGEPHRAAWHRRMMANEE